MFCKLQPGLPVLALHGKQQQMKRMEVYTCFVRKKAAVLFATDIAARGLGRYPPRSGAAAKAVEALSDIIL